MWLILQQVTGDSITKGAGIGICHLTWNMVYLLYVSKPLFT